MRHSDSGGHGADGLVILCHVDDTQMNLRIDKRRNDEMRRVQITKDYIQTAEGCVLIEVGNTRVLCAATLESTVPQFLKGSGKGWVTAEYAMLPRATETRTQREVMKGKQTGRTMEIQRLVGRSLRAVVDLAAMGERSIIVDCDVLQADGGTRTASITGAFIAMALVMERMVNFGTLQKLPLLDYLAATSVGMVDGAPMLDLCYSEDSRAEVDMNVVLTGGGKFVEVQASAEQKSFDDDQMEGMLGLARSGIASLVEMQKTFVRLP